jgi:hypothetical protein
MRRLALLLAGAALLAMFYAPPAQAGTVIACNGHRQIAFHETAGGNRYQLFAHNCIDDTLSLGSHWYQARTHWHCYRNGSPYDGCRLNTRLTIQTFSLISGWVDETSTRASSQIRQPWRASRSTPTPANGSGGRASTLTTCGSALLTDPQSSRT